MGTFPERSGIRKQWPYSTLGEKAFKQILSREKSATKLKYLVR